METEQPQGQLLEAVVSTPPGDAAPTPDPKPASALPLALHTPPDAEVLAPAPLRSLELRCGSANVSAAPRKVGIEAVGVDYVRNASQPRAPCVQLDLSSQASI